MDPYEHLRKVELFRDLPDDDLGALCRASDEIELDDGAVLFRQGDEGDAAYVIAAGELEILQDGAEREVLLALRGPGEVIGEMALLRDEPRMASARARGDVRLLRVPQPALTQLLDTSPTAVRGLFDIILDRLRATEGLLRQNERMAQLGTLTAGVAHELNNPAAAVRRAADQLADAVRAYGTAVAASAPVLDDEARAVVEELAHQAPSTEPLGALERSDREQELEDALADAGVEEPWTVAADLVEAGIGPDDLARLEGADLTAALATVGAGRAVESLVRSIESGSDRLSSIVGALKSYSFLDQSPVQDVDVTVGLEDTILILGEKLTGIVVERDYAPDLHRIEALGSELNQVWTNLLANAADAIEERREAEGDGAAGRIVVRAGNVDGGIAVSITDDGVGIPPENVARIFDSFFTTKEPGKGTGLGLDISYRIVVSGHGGDLRVDSEPGRTTFTVELPAP